MDHIPIGEHVPDPHNVVPLTGPDEAATPDEEMSYEEAIAADARTELDPSAATGSFPGSQAAELVGQGIRISAGMLAAGASALADALRATLPGDDGSGIPAAHGDADPAATLAGAALGAAVTAAEGAAAAAKQLGETIGPAMTWLVEPRLAKDASATVAGAARLLDGRWKASQAEMITATATFLGTLLPEIAQGVAERIDLTALVRERADVNAIVDDIDVDRIVDRIDLDALMARIDTDAVAERLARRLDEAGANGGTDPTRPEPRADRPGP